MHGVFARTLPLNMVLYGSGVGLISTVNEADLRRRGE